MWAAFLLLAVGLSILGVPRFIKAQRESHHQPGDAGVVMANGICTIGIQGVSEWLHPTTREKYREQFGEWPGTLDFLLYGVAYDTRSGHVLIIYSKADDIEFNTAEIWDGCEFVESTDWN